MKKKTRPHEHIFKNTRGGFNGKKILCYLDFDCVNCNMSMFVKGKFSWHCGDSVEKVLRLRDLAEMK